MSVHMSLMLLFYCCSLCSVHLWLGKESLRLKTRYMSEHRFVWISISFYVHTIAYAKSAVYYFVYCSTMAKKKQKNRLYTSNRVQEKERKGKEVNDMTDRDDQRTTKVDYQIESE